MWRKIQRIIVLCFVAATVISTGTMLYALDSYVGVYRAVRNINISIKDLDVKLFNTTHAEIKNTIALQNPSPYEFYLIGVEQTIYLDDEYLAFTRSQKPSISDPLQMPPESETYDIAIVTSVPPEQLASSMDDSEGEGSFWIFVLVQMEGPIVGRFRLSTSRQIQAEYSVAFFDWGNSNE